MLMFHKYGQPGMRIEFPVKFSKNKLFGNDIVSFTLSKSIE
jgi:hypothetical protein